MVLEPKLRRWSQNCSSVTRLGLCLPLRAAGELPLGSCHSGRFRRRTVMSAAPGPPRHLSGIAGKRSKGSRLSLACAVSALPSQRPAGTQARATVRLLATRA